MKKEVIKKVTIDNLAKMITDGREETNELARMVAKGFDRVEERIGKVEGKLEKVEERLGNVEENLAATRRDVLEIGDRFTFGLRPGRESGDSEFHDLLVRFDRLEQKVKGK